VTQIDRIEDVMSPVANPEIDDAVNRSLISFVGTNMFGEMYVRVQPAHDAGSVFDEMAIGIVVSVFYDNTEAATFPLALLDSPDGDRTAEIRFKLPSDPKVEWRLEEQSRWTVRVKGDIQTAITDVMRSRYWSGDYTAPLSEFTRK
jgi:hypothetical protein